LSNQKDLDKFKKIESMGNKISSPIDNSSLEEEHKLKRFILGSFGDFSESDILDSFSSQHKLQTETTTTDSVVPPNQFTQSIGTSKVRSKSLKFIPMLPTNGLLSVDVSGQSKTPRGAQYSVYATPMGNVSSLVQEGNSNLILLLGGLDCGKCKS